MRRCPLSLLLMLPAIALLSAGCSRRPPERVPTATKAAAEAAAAPSEAADKPAKPAREQVNSKRWDAIRKATGKALCKLADKADPHRDRALIGPVIELAHKRRRHEQDRACFFTLLTEMRANEALLEVAEDAATVTRWLAVLDWAGRNLRAKHFRVYNLALAHPQERVRMSAVAQLGRHSASPAALKTLAKALTDKSAAVRIKAVGVAGRMDHPEAAMRLHKARRVEQDKAVLAAIDRILSR